MRVWLAIVAAAVVVAGEWVAAGMHPTTRVLDALAGAAFLGVGVVSAGRSKRYTLLAAFAGVAWFAGGVSELVLWIHRPLMVHCALAYPSGGLRQPSARIIVVALWVDALIFSLARDEIASLVLAVGVAVAGWRLVAGAPLSRRATTRTGAQSVGVLAASLAVTSAARFGWPDAAAGLILINLYSALVSVAGLILLGGLLLQPEGRATDFVVEFTEDDPAETLAALRRELTDRDDPASRAAIVAAIDLLDSNVALHDDLADKVNEVRASRRRLVEAAVAERHRLERRLADGAVRYLDEMAGTLHALLEEDDERTRDLAGKILDEVTSTRADLAQLARGLHPRVLVDHGLAVALRELAAGLPVPTTVRVPDSRFPMIVESTVWYACAEAITNLAKHAEARNAVAEVWVEGDDVVACVRDDGVGGARAVPSGGLAGLADRLSAVDGELVVVSPPDGGTRVQIRVPLR